MTVEQLNVIVTANNADFNQKISQVNARLIEMQNTSKISAANTLASFKNLAVGLGALGIGNMIKKSITAGMDAIESDNLFETSLGKYADSARKWSEQLRTAFGLNASKTRENVGMLYTMTQSMGLAGGQAYNMSKSLVELSGDMMSFYDLTETEAFTKLTAGITGETEPLKRLGILVDENTVKQVAYKKGIAETGAELTQQQKVLARYAAIMEQTATAQGDLARTIDSPANQLRRLQDQILTTQQEIGKAFMPLVQTVLPLITQMIKEATPTIVSLTREAGGFIQTLVGMGTPLKLFITFLGTSLVMIPLTTKAINILTAAKRGMSGVLDVLMFKQRTFNGILRSSITYFSILAGALAMASAAYDDTRRKTAQETFEKEWEKYEKELEAYNAEKAQIDEEFYNNTMKQVGATDELAEAQKQLMSFDELNKLSNGVVKAVGSLSDIGEPDYSNMVNKEPVMPVLGDIDTTLTDALNWLFILGNLLFPFLRDNKNNRNGGGGGGGGGGEYSEEWVNEQIKKLEYVASEPIFSDETREKAKNALERFAGDLNGLNITSLNPYIIGFGGELQSVTSDLNGINISLLNSYISEFGTSIQTVINELYSQLFNQTLQIPQYSSEGANFTGPQLPQFVNEVIGKSKPTLEELGIISKGNAAQVQFPTSPSVDMPSLSELLEAQKQGQNVIPSDNPSEFVKELKNFFPNYAKAIQSAWDNTVKMYAENPLETFMSDVGKLFEGIGFATSAGALNGISVTLKSVTATDEVLETVKYSGPKLAPKIAETIENVSKAAAIAAAIPNIDINSELKENLKKYRTADYTAFENIIKPYASGGIPDYGEIFMARENGMPEFVGKFGNRSVVANNVQIIEGITRGVDNAISKYFKNGNSNTPINIHVHVDLDGDEIGETVVRYQNNRLIRTNGKD